VHPDSLCVVTGRVVTAAEGTPLKSARIALMLEQSRSDAHPYAATSDDDGRFLLKDVPPGRYQLLAMRAGFVEQQYQSQELLLTERYWPLLKPGQKISDVMFRMIRAAVITGRVNNEDGEPLIGVQIVALQRPTEEEIEDKGLGSSQKRELRPATMPELQCH
jgi:carboxypeptidase family protein